MLIQLSLLYIKVFIDDPVSRRFEIMTNELKKEIRKHSVHPHYGDYQQRLYKCHPWDSCNRTYTKLAGKEHD